MNNDPKSTMNSSDKNSAADGAESVATATEQATGGQNTAPSETINMDPMIETQKQRDEFQQQWLRAVADLENYRKRAMKDLEEERRFRALPLVRDLLPVIDNLHRTVAAAGSATDVTQLLSGVQMVLKQVDDLLGKHGVTAIPAVGQPFDPNLHQAVQQIPTADVAPMTVLTEYEKGYTLHDRVIRPAAVTVAMAAQ